MRTPWRWTVATAIVYSVNMDSSVQFKTSTIVSLIRHVASECGANTAVEFGSSTLCYRTLDALSDTLASYLKDRFKVGTGDFIGICMDPSPNAIVAMLAVLKVGAAYVPFDAELPKQRIAYMFRDTQLKLVLTQRRYSIDIAVAAIGQGQISILQLDQDTAWQQHRSDWDVKSFEPAPNDLAYVIYTSGSTGVPKGVMIEHRGLINLIYATVDILKVSEKTRLVQFSSFAFDAAVWEIYTALGGGATLVMGSREDMLPGRALATFLARNRVTMVIIPPSLLASIHDAMADVSWLNTVIAGAEACPLATARAWSASGRRFFNAYGPTEITVCATMYEFQGGEESVPIGRPLAGVTTYVVDAELNRVPPGQTGELMIGGVGVARGYLGKPELTASRFVQSPFGDGRLYHSGDIVSERPDGAIEFIGRRDNQVKIRGLRVEIEAIETALCEHPSVQNAAVTVAELQTQNTESTKTLVGYFVPQSGADAKTLTPEALSRFLAGRLPSYMIPPIYVQLDVMPMKPNRSKIDRAALPPPTSKRVASQTMSGRTKQIATLFDQALDLPLGTFERDEHFFQMGGDSMNVAHLVMAIKTEFGIRIPARAIYQHPTPSSLAALVEDILRSPYYTATAEIVDMHHEARLEGVLPATEVSPGPVSPQVILFTGGTGFMGTALLQELLQRRPDLKIYCLVRSDSVEHARARLGASLKNYGLPLDLLDKVHVVPGDLENDGMGIPSAEYEQLAAEVDTIYHCAADIQYVKPYSIMKKPNVDGTKNALRFAATGRPKTLQYVSTAGVFGSTPTLLGIDSLDESYDINLSAPIINIENGYTKSKWVAERIVQAASERGVRVALYRLGFVAGNSKTGISNISDLLSRMLCGCIQMGSYPDFPQKYWYITPVDYAAGAIAHISLSGGTGPYHILVRHEQDLRHNDMFDIVNAQGYPVRPILPAEWLEALATVPGDNHLYPITSFLLEKMHEGRNTLLEVHHKSVVCGVDRTVAALAGSDVVIPTIGAELIAKYLSYFISCGLIKGR